MFLQVTSLDENQYFFDSTRQASHSLKKAKKAKEGLLSRWHLPVVEIMAVFTSFILLSSQCSCSPLPGDVQEEALAQRDPGQRSSRRPHLSFSPGIPSFKPPRVASMHDLCGASVQEVPKYLKGRHNCTREDMIHLGGLLFRIQVDSDKSRFVAIPKMLKDLVPADQINIMTPEDWKKVK